MKTKYIYLIVAIIIVTAANIGPTHSVFSFFLDLESGYYKYSTYNGEFTFIERSKGNNTEMMLDRFNAAKKDIPLKNAKVYRVFWKNPLCFWRWASYFTDKRYDLPYISWKDARKRRGYDLKGYATSYQEF